MMIETLRACKSGRARWRLNRRAPLHLDEFGRGCYNSSSLRDSRRVLPENTGTREVIP